MRTLLRTFGCLLMMSVATTRASAEEFVWAVQTGVNTPSAGGYAVGTAVDSSGNVVTVGNFSGTVDFDPGPGVYNLTSIGSSVVFILKLDRFGNFLWAKRVGESLSNWQYHQALGVSVDSNGNVVTVGQFYGTVDFDPGPGSFDLTAAAQYDSFILKLDSVGNFVWAKRVGGSDSDYSNAVTLDGSGNVVTVGQFYGTVDFDPGPGVYNVTSGYNFSAFILKLDSVGNFVWAGAFGGGYNIPRGVALDSSGNVVTVGEFWETTEFDPGPDVYNLTSAGQADIFVSKLDSNGNFLWARSMDGPLHDDVGRGVAVDATGNVYTTGNFYSTVDFDPGPGTYNLPSTGPSDDIFVSKLDSNGNFLWAKQMVGSSLDGGYSIAVDTEGHVFTTGTYQGTVDFDPGLGTYYLTWAGGQADIFISKIDSNGNFLWAGSIGGGPAANSYEKGTSIVVDNSGMVYLTGYYAGDGDFDPGPGFFYLTGGAGYNVFVEKLSPCSEAPGSSYGHLIFSPICTRDAAGLLQDVYASLSLPLYRRHGDRFYVSSEGDRFTVLAVDDAVHVAGLDSGLGPYAYQPGVPPFILGMSITQNLVPLPPQEITNLIPLGTNNVLFEALDTQRTIYGNTAVYLVQDCGIWLSGNAPTAINYVTHDDQVAGLPPEFDVRGGYLSQLRGDRNFSRASCLGHFFNTPATETLPNPPAGDGYYYLARGLSSCVAQGYGDSTLVPDPRATLNAQPTCP